MTTSSPADARPRTATLVHGNTQLPLLEAPFIPPPTARFAASHEASQTRGRASSATNSQNASPRETYASAQAQLGQSTDAGVERKPSQSQYGHHRQTSIVHGLPHSRTASTLSSVHASPLGAQNTMLSRPSDAAAQHTLSDLPKSPSMSALHGNTSNAAVLPLTRSFDAASPRRPERMHSGRFRRPHEHQRSLSRTQAQSTQEPTTVGEYALHHLFTNFIAAANERIELCIVKPGHREPPVEDVCGPGADAAFDQLISSLGHINRHKPKSLIDAMIRWRKTKGETANVIAAEIQHARESATSIQPSAPNGTFVTSLSPAGAQAILILEHKLAIADRRSAVSIYILCRVLIEAIGQTTLSALNGSEVDGNTAARLEDVIYSQMHSADPDSLATAPVRKANWVIRSQLLGVMSGLRFEEVVEKFLRDIQQAHWKLAVKGSTDSKLAAKTAMLVQSMRWLKVRTRPEVAWSRSCDMLLTIGKFFAEVHGKVMKHAYAELLEHLLLPIAGTATTIELNLPRWKEVLTIVQPKITQMLPKADHWPHVFPLQAVLLCVSPADQFASSWLALATSSQARAKDRSARSHALKAICRLVWRYLYRHEEAQHVVSKRLDELIRTIFHGGKKFMISTDPLIADPLIQLIRIIGFKNQDLCFRMIIFPLMNSELFSNSIESQLKIESLDPEKTVIAIRAFLAIMGDLEKNRSPSFPTSFECDALLDPASRAPITHRRTKSQGISVSAGRTERLSQPVLTVNFNEVTKEYYVKFCKILGQLTIVCDNAFGGQAVLDEKISTHAPKTPMAEAFTFNKRDDGSSATDIRQHYYDLLHVAVEALPRCLAPHLPINALVNLLCTGTAHTQAHIASSSVQSLKSIARQSNAQQVTIGFARFIFNFDDRYATVSDSSLLGPGHIGGTLRLYLELLQIWIDQIRNKTQPVDSITTSGGDQPRQFTLDQSSVLAHVDEVESHGLFFLCSPSPSVRAIAVNVLRLVTQFDIALGKPVTRIVNIMETPKDLQIEFANDKLSLAERSRLRKGSNNPDSISILSELCSSDVRHDAALWFKIFPSVVRFSSRECYSVAALTRELVCQRLSHTNRMVSALADGSRQFPNTALDLAMPPGRQGNRFHSSQPDVIIEQWKIHLMFACITVTNIATNQAQLPKSSHGPQHSRKSSKSSSSGQEKITSALDLFSRAVPFLTVPNAAVRNAAVIGLGTTNAVSFPTLLQALQPYVAECSNEVKERVALHQRNLSSPRRNRRTDSLRTDITQLLSLTCHHVQVEAKKTILDDDYALGYLLDYAKYLRIYLSDAEIQGDFELQKCRTYFCYLVECLYNSVRHLKDAIRYMSFSSRHGLFSLMENWCGFSPNEGHLRQHEEHVRRSMLEQEPDIRRLGMLSSDLEKQKVELQNAALSAMSALCAGPLSFVAEGRILNQFDTRRLLAWIESIFENASDVNHAAGRRALHNLIAHNSDQTLLLSQVIRTCYTVHHPKSLASYFEVVSEIVGADSTITMPYWKIICIGLFMLSSENTHLRMTSARLIHAVERLQANPCKVRELEIGISDKTTSVYKLAQFEMSQRLAKQHPDTALHVLSEISSVFNELRAEQQRSMVSVMLPWVQTVELQEDANGRPSSPSYILLVNLFEITVKNGVALHHEVQALWQSLAAGPAGVNTQLILSFLIDLCLEKKEQNFVVYAKQIVVFLSKSPDGAQIIDHLLTALSPRNMISEPRQPAPTPSDPVNLPYMADLDQMLPGGTRQNGMSLAQLCMVLLVDLVVSPLTLSANHIPTLLHVAIVQWDQYLPIVQDQAREMIVHLIHELVVARIEPGSTEPKKSEIEDFIEVIRGQQPTISWAYADNELETSGANGRAVLGAMSYVVGHLVRIFSIISPGIREAWGKIAVEWATTCAVQHTACRSLQVFRCFDTPLDRKMLNLMLHRLAKSIADSESNNYPVFSMEILTTIRVASSDLPPDKLLQHPEIFWTACTCLESTSEIEFQEGLSMLELLLDNVDLRDVEVMNDIASSQPTSWEGPFEGVHALLHKGVRSQQSMDRSIRLMERLVECSSSDLIGRDDRILCTLLANLPRYLYCFHRNPADVSCLESAGRLGSVAETHKQSNLANVLQGFVKSKSRTQEEFLAQVVEAIRADYFPRYELQTLVFLLGMVNNQCAWFKVQTMHVLKVVIAGIDMRNPDIASQGPDLISPLLRVLHTEHCQQALDVLDNVLDMAGPSANAKHLRMSMAGSHSSWATRKEYESTRSLYGIPEQSGWSVPMPAISAERTRRHVLAIAEFLDSTVWDGLGEATMTPKFEFQDPDAPDNYFGSHTSHASLGDMKVDGSMSELAMKLDSLDDFFDEPEDEGLPDGMGSNAFSNGFVEERESVYDQQALPILRRSLGRNPSVSSFRTGFNDSVYPPLQEPNVMNPMAFAQDGGLLARPGLHNRSATSPVMSMKTVVHPTHHELTYGSDVLDETDIGSDDEFALERAHTTDELFQAQDTVKPAGFKAGLRSGLRRLTSTNTKGEARDALKATSLSAKSPRVPRVPLTFLSQPMSAEP